MKIVTDAKTLEDVKDPEDSIIVDLYAFLAEDEKLAEMKSNFLLGNYGYGHAKQALFEVIMDRFSNERKEHDKLMADLNAIDEVLLKGAEKAKIVARNTITHVRSKMGYNV
jgi:tryptophanyl-tRNA synthetase